MIARTIGQSGFTRLWWHDPASHEAYGASQVNPPAPETLETGPLAVDFARGEARVNGAPVHLSAREWQLLRALARRPGELWPTPSLIVEAWGELYLETGWAHLLHVVLARLRQRLGVARDLIVNVPGVGYRLEIVPVGCLPAPRPCAARICLDGRWSLAHERCVCCGKTNSTHAGHGRCLRCRGRSFGSHYGPCTAPPLAGSEADDGR